MKTMLFLFFLVTILFTSSYGQNTYYFSSSEGNDINNGLTPSTAKQTLSVLQTLLNTSQPGDKFLLKRGDTWTVRGGTYGIEVNNVQGAPGSYIEIGSYATGNYPVLNLSGTAAEIYFTNGSSNHYIKFRTLKFTTTASAGSRPYWGIWEYNSTTSNVIVDSCIIDGCGEGIGTNEDSYWTITNCQFLNTWQGNSQADGGEALFSNGTSHITFSNNYIAHNPVSNSKGHAVYLSGENGSDYALCENNEVYDTYGGGFAVVNGTGTIIRHNTVHGSSNGYGIVISSRPTPTSNSLSDLLVERNTFYDCVNGIVFSKTFTNPGDPGVTYTSNVRIINNVIYNTAGADWAFGMLVENNGNTDELVLDNNLFANNTIVNCYAGCIYFVSKYITYNSNFIVKNNTFYNSAYSSSVLINIMDAAVLSEVSLDHNLYYNTAGTTIKVGSTNYDLTTFQSTFGQEANAVSGNPLFTNLSTFDFHLNENSPAIDKGVYIFKCN